MIMSVKALRKTLSSAVATYKSPELALLHVINEYDFSPSLLEDVLLGVSL